MFNILDVLTSEWTHSWSCFLLSLHMYHESNYYQEIISKVLKGHRENCFYPLSFSSCHFYDFSSWNNIWTSSTKSIELQVQLPIHDKDNEKMLGLIHKMFLIPIKVIYRTHILTGLFNCYKPSPFRPKSWQWQYCSCGGHA